MIRLINRAIPCREGDTVLIGLSGGADSVALAYALKEEYPKLCLAACHLNHGLRGEEGDRDENFVRAYCDRLSIPLFCKKVFIRDICKESGESEEECGRRLRYEFFSQTSRELQLKTKGTVWTATAHTASDQVETMLFHLTRGSGVKGLCGIPDRRGTVIRPLLSVTREEIEHYCSEMGLDYVTDSTNCCDQYTRNRIRHHVIPQLRKINPSLEQSFLQTADILKTEEAFWEEYIDRQYSGLQKDGGLSVTDLRRLHPAVQRRILLRYLKENRVPGYFYQVDQALQVLRDGKKCSMKKSLYLERSGEVLILSDKRKPCPYFEFSLQEGLFESKTGKMYKIQILETNPFAFFHKIYKNVFDILLDCGKICGSISIRQKKSGDRIKLDSSAGTKTLKKLLNERHVDCAIRDRIFVIADEQGVVAVEGVGVAERVRCDQTTTKWIQIEPVKGMAEDER